MGRSRKQPQKLECPCSKAVLPSLSSSWKGSSAALLSVELQGMGACRYPARAWPESSPLSHTRTHARTWAHAVYACRALKTKHETPKYGLIYHASLIGQSSSKFKGKVSRVLAAKCALATRVDALGDSEDASIGE
eukprot:scaffold130849_cov23-Tisochrysis_lutea.AAC.2